MRDYQPMTACVAAPAPVSGIRRALDQLTAIVNQAQDLAAQQQKTFNPIVNPEPRTGQSARPDTPASGCEVAREIFEKVGMLQSSLDAIRDVIHAADL